MSLDYRCLYIVGGIHFLFSVAMGMATYGLPYAVISGAASIVYCGVAYLEGRQRKFNGNKYLKLHRIDHWYVAVSRNL